jgi:hypothetical protein
LEKERITVAKRKSGGMGALIEAETKRRISPRADGRKSVGKVDFVRADVVNLLYSWYLVRDCIAGEPAIKGFMASDVNPGLLGVSTGPWETFTAAPVLNLAKRYLPMPNSADTSEANKARYEAYLKRAIFYEVTGRTLDGLCGEIFKRSPDVELPVELEGLIENADTEGLSLEASAYQATQTTISYGRTGVWVDYPARDKEVTVAEARDGVQPILKLYEPFNIPNWRVKNINGKQKLTLVVLREFEELDDDDFQLKIAVNYRVLRLSNDVYTSELWERDEAGGFVSQGVTTPVDSQGKPFDEITFWFIGSGNNNVMPNRAPLYSLASVNIGHYRNSADYEDACFLCGQPTPVLMGLTQQWVKDVLKDKIELGSRAAIPLPVGGNAILLQAAANSMPFEAMGHKEEQMVSLGAKLVQPAQSGSGGKSATGELIESASEGSVLTNTASNVSVVFTKALRIAARFQGADPTKVKFELNQDFDLQKQTPDEQNATVSNWQKGAFTFGEMRDSMKKSGIATDNRSHDEVLADILKQSKQLTKAGLKADPNKPNPKVPSKKAASKAGGPQPATK